MLDVRFGDKGEILFNGRFDASEADKVQTFMDAVTVPSVVDFKGLQYISSAGLGVILSAQKRLIGQGGGGLKLVNVSRHIREIFRFSGLDQVFEIHSHTTD